jgi:hypothetical protein
MNKLSKEQIFKIKFEIIKIADKMIKDEIDLIEGCRQITSLQSKLNNSDSAFLVFRGIASETYDIPIGKERNTWSKESLARLDLEKKEYLVKVKRQILAACLNVKKKLEVDLH